MTLMEADAKKAGAALTVPTNILLILFVAALCFLAAVFFAGSVRINEERIYEGTAVNGIDIGGMTLAQGGAAVRDACSEQLDNTTVTVVCDGEETTLTARELGGSIDFESAIAGTFYSSGSVDFTKAMDAIFRPVQGSSKNARVSVDGRSIVRQMSAMLNKYNIEPADATVTFDAKTKTFNYSNEKSGRSVDIAQTAEAVAARLSQELATCEHIDAPIEVVCETIAPKVTAAELRANTVLIGSCVTEATKNANRNTNIRLMCQAIDGYEIASGETLSINGLVGERTDAKGFKEAGAIVNGDIVDAVGGGICQLAGTLYNAALESNMEIVERVRHTYPSNYLPVGLDATLHWNNKDLKIKNTTDHAIYVSAQFDETEFKVTVELYGQPLPDNETLTVEADVLKEIKPKGPVVIYTTDLPAGEERVVTPALTGYEVVVYRKHFVDGELTVTETISRDTYNTRQKKVLVGVNEWELK